MYMYNILKLFTCIKQIVYCSLIIGGASSNYAHTTSERYISCMCMIQK